MIYQEVTIHLKSGQSFTIAVDRMKITTHRDGEFTFSWWPLKEPGNKQCLEYIDDSIAAITSRYIEEKDD